MTERLLEIENLVVEYPAPGLRAKPFRVLHGVSLAGRWHAVVVTPSHCPAQTPLPPHAARPPCGAPAAGEQTLRSISIHNASG